MFGAGTYANTLKLRWCAWSNIRLQLYINIVIVSMVKLAFLSKHCCAKEQPHRGTAMAVDYFSLVNS